MRITETYIRKVIRQELKNILSEAGENEDTIKMYTQTILKKLMAMASQGSKILTFKQLSDMFDFGDNEQENIQMIKDIFARFIQDKYAWVKPLNSEKQFSRKPENMEFIQLSDPKSSLGMNVGNLLSRSV
jgi:hypothetical protein